MATDPVSAAAESAEKTGWRMIKWTLALFSSLAVLGMSFWALFYSSHFANFPLIISLRNFYFTYLPQPSEIEAVGKSQDGNFTYHFSGKFYGIDSNRQILSLKDTNNDKIYKFIVGDNLADQATDKYIIKLKTLTPSSPNIVRILWYDKKTLSQIQNNYARDPTIPVNFDQFGVLSIRVN